MMDEKFLHDTGVEAMRVVKTTLKAYRTFSKLAVEGEKVSVCGLQVLTTLRYYPELNTVSDLADSLEFSKGLISREVETLRKGNYVTTSVGSELILISLLQQYMVIGANILHTKISIIV